MDTPSHPSELKRAISLPLLSFYGLGTILGAGIYVLIGEVVSEAGLYAPIAFLIAALLAVFTAFSYAELSARFPRSAGEAVYIQEGFHYRRLSVAIGLLVVFIGLVSSATIANGFVGYFQIFFDLPAWLIISVLVLLLGLIAVWGITESVLAASLITVIEIGGLLLVIAIAGDALATLPARLPELVPVSDGAIWLSILSGAFLAFYAFIGFEDMVNVAEEVKEPRHTLPRAILIALVVSSLLYVLIALVAVLALPVGELTNNGAPLARIYEYKTGEAPVVITLISLVAVVNGALIQIIMASRVLYGLSWQGWIPGPFARIHPRTQTPVIATLVVTVVILLLALYFPLLTLAKATSYVTLLVFALVNLSLWRIKRHYPCESGSICFPRWMSLLGFVISLAFVLFQIWQEV